MAEAVMAGVASVPDTEVVELSIQGSDIVAGRFKNPEFLARLDEVDGMIFGSPTYMGCVSAQFKAFADATGERWFSRAWADKVAGGFTIGSAYSGDQLYTIQYLSIFASQHGMLWVSLDTGGSAPEQLNRLGAQSGLIAQSADGSVHAVDSLTAKYLGERVTRIAKGFKAN